MTSQLTQAELVDRLRITASEIIAEGHLGWGNVCNDAADVFAQLIQQRRGEVIAWRWRYIFKPMKTAFDWTLTQNFKDIEKLQVEDYPGNPYGYEWEEVYSAPPTASQLVAQALEKAAQYVERGIENPKISLLQITDWIRALIDQPVEPNDAATIADYEECLASHRALVRELDVALNGEDGAAKQASLCDVVAQVKHGNWKLVKVATLQDPVVRIAKVLELHELFQSKRLTPNTREGWKAALELYSEPAEQGGDALADLLPEKKVFRPNALIGDDANQFMEGMVNGFNDCLEQVRQALANRRSGE